LYYRRRSPEAEELPVQRAGREYHQRRLSAERRHAVHPWAYWGLVVVGAGLVTVGLLGGRLL